MSKYKIRTLWVAFDHPQYGRLSKLVTTREWARDSTGQLWVVSKGVCCKALKARPYTMNWIDDLFN